MEIVEVHGGVLLVEGHDVSQADMRDGIRGHLVARGWDEWSVETALAGARLDRAWYSDELGFANEGHEGARPVTIAVIPNATW